MRRNPPWGKVALIWWVAATAALALSWFDESEAWTERFLLCVVVAVLYQILDVLSDLRFERRPR